VKRVGPALVAACFAATAAMILFAFPSLAYRGNVGQLFVTPIPYAILFLCFFFVTPAYVLLHRWVGLSLPRFVGIALLLGAMLFVKRGLSWNWHPVFLTGPGPLWCFGFPLIGALAYWAVLKKLAPELGET
jgi:hypothetical protein